MGILSLLQSGDTKSALIILLYQIPAVLIALTLHELGHGYAALRCGDPTAQMMGRLSFNPIRHLDPFGTLVMFLFGFGWARPVPVNSRNFKHFRRDDLLVSIAGVTVNFLLFFVSMWLIALVNELMWAKETWTLGPLATREQFLRFDSYNFISVLSGSGIIYAAPADQGFYVAQAAPFLKIPWLMYVQRFLMFFSSLNLSLCIFNLLPIPPLDGYHVVNDVLLKGRLHIPSNVLSIFMIGLLVVMYTTSFISTFLYTVRNFVQGGVLQLILLVFGG